MSIIIQQPDALSFSGNLKKFEIQSDAEVIFELSKLVGIDRVIITSEKYQPDADGLLTIDTRAIIERLLEIKIPENQNIINEQPTAIGDYFARVDDVAIYLRIIKGGVAELQETASTWLAGHWLTWQPQAKSILQTAPEWLGIYPLTAGVVRAKAYYTDNTTFTGDFATLEVDKLYSIYTSWGAVSAWLIGQAVAWDIWYEVDGIRTTPIQRYQLRNAEIEEHGFIWSNTLGGIDSASFTGSSEEDQKLEHKNALYEDETIGEYDIDKAREVRQSTGFLNTDQSRWLQDFFVSRKKYVVRADGSLKAIAVVSSKIVSISADDEFDYEFTYRYGEDTQLLNLERTLSPLPAPEGLADFFLTELLSGLTEALYSGNLLMAVQSPFAQGWQILSLAQLFFGALSEMVDGWTIKLLNGKLSATGGGGGGGLDTTALQELRDYIDSLTNNYNDTRTELISGAVLWKIGLTYISTIINYKIFGVKYQANSKEFTLYSDPNFSIFFTFFVDMFANLNFVAGIASANPTKPILLSTQLEVMTVLVGPGALQPSNVDVEKVYDENDPLTEWTASIPEQPDEYVSIDFEDDNEPLNGSKRISVKVSVPDSATNSPMHYIGKPYQGGKIFRLNPNGKSGLIVAETDVADNVFYERLSGGAPYTTGASGVEIGTGQENTALLLANDRAKDQAVRYCAELVVDGFNDFFFPSEKELYEIYIRRFDIGGLGSKIRWSSTEVTGSYNWKRARCISFSDGTAYTRDKNNQYSVLAIRAFDDNTLPTNVPVPTYAPTAAIMKFATATPVSVNAGILSLNIKSSLPWQFNSMLLFESYLGAVKTGTVAMAATTNLFNYKPGDESWQLIALQMYQFAPGKSTLDSFRISLTGSWTNNIDLGIDDIRFQYSDIVIANATQDIIRKINQSLVESPDGIRTEFTTLEPYIKGTTELFRNGIKQTINDYYTETNGKIVFAIAPKATSGLTINYDTLKK